MDAGFDVTVRRHGRVVVVHPRGVLTFPTATELRRLVVDELRGHGQVVVDLDGFQLGPQGSWVEIFPAALVEGGGWPTAKVALCRPDKRMAHELAERRISTFVPVCHLFLEAEAAIDRRPEVVRTHTQLPCDASASATARQVVRDVCPQWQVDGDLQDIAQAVVSELVDITVRPRGTAAGLSLEQGPRGFQVAVRDGSPTWLPPVEQCRAGGLRRLGLGMEVLGNLTTAWGVDVRPEGCTAWAEITNELGAKDARPARVDHECPPVPGPREYRHLTADSAEPGPGRRTR